MSETNLCVVCGHALPPDAPNGSCPECLLGLARNGARETAGAFGLSSHSDPAGNGFSVPNAEQLMGRFPNLEIEHLLGRGGMGAVYSARQTNLDRIVALKILSPRLGDDPSFTERFTREARTLARLTHPNIVTVFDFGKTDSMYYLVMEYIDGVNLRDAIQLGRIQPDRALEIVQQICKALQYAHDEGIIHRDIKPENILIDRRGHVKIADFGLAKLLQPAETDFTLTGTRQVLGTLNYMAPEQIEKPQTVDHRADLYSLGVVFYELLTGELPIGRFAPPSEKSKCTTGLDDVVMRTLEKEPDRRFQQASQISSAVDTLGAALAAEGSMPVSEIVESVAGYRDAGQLRKTKRNDSVTDSVPFSLGWIIGKWHTRLGTAKCMGLARAFEDRIELDLEIHDALSSVEHRRIELPLDELASVEFHPSVMGGRIEIQAASLIVVKDVPGARQGRTVLKTRSADAHKAADFASQVSRQIAIRNPGRTIAPRPPLKDSIQNQVTDEDIVTVDERLKVPRVGMLVAAALHLIVMFVTFLIGSFLTVRDLNSRMPSLNFDVGPIFLLTALGALIAALLLYFVSRNLKQHLNYHFVIAGLIVLIPLYPPALFLHIVFVVWALVVMCLRQTRDVFRTETLEMRLRPSHVPAPVPQGRRNSGGIGAVILTVVLVVVLLLAFVTIWTYRSYESLDPASPVSVTQAQARETAQPVLAIGVPEMIIGTFVVGGVLAIIAMFVARLIEYFSRRRARNNIQSIHDHVVSGDANRSDLVDIDLNNVDEQCR